MCAVYNIHSTNLSFPISSMSYVITAQIDLFSPRNSHHPYHRERFIDFLGRELRRIKNSG